jgi:hypothetical protein
VTLAPIERTLHLASWTPGAALSPAATATEADNPISEVKLRMTFLDQVTSICKLMHNKPIVLQFSLRTADVFLCLPAPALSRDAFPLPLAYLTSSRLISMVFSPRSATRPRPFSSKPHHSLRSPSRHRILRSGPCWGCAAPVLALSRWRWPSSFTAIYRDLASLSIRQARRG